MEGEKDLVILIFGVSNVGKTVVGRKLAERLNYPFFDLDDEIKRTFDTTLEEFMKSNRWSDERYKKKGIVLKNIIVDNGDDMVIAVSPIFDSKYFNFLLDLNQVIAVELQDTEEHIFERLVFSDEDDNIYFDEEYKLEHMDYYLRDIHEDILALQEIFEKIQWKYFVDNKPIEQVADELLELLSDKVREKKKICDV